VIATRDQWRYGYDSTTPRAIPRDAQMVFPYVLPSQYAWTPAEIALFPHAVVVRITVHGTVPDYRQASIIDVEGNRSDPAHFSFTPEQARQFVINRNRFRPDTATVYCNRDKLPSVQAALRGLSWHLWLAQPDNDPHVVPPYPNIVAKQYLWHRDYDKSVIYNPQWHHAHAHDNVPPQQ
jgi:hypothetical protein